MLLTKLRALFQSVDGGPIIPDSGLHAFMEHSSKRIGDAYFRTPRTTIRSFVQLMAVLEQNPDANWRELLGTVEILPDTGDTPSVDAAAVTPDDELTSFKL